MPPPEPGPFQGRLRGGGVYDGTLIFGAHAGGPFDIVFCDLRLPDTSGMDVLARCKAVRSETEVIIITGYGSIDSAIEAIKEGAYHYATKPLKLNEIRVLTRGALDRISMRQENQRLREALKFSAGLSNDRGEQPGRQRAFLDGSKNRPGGLQHFAPGRKRHGQGPGGEGHTPVEPEEGPSFRLFQLRRVHRGTHQQPSFSATKRERSPGPRQPKSVCSNRRREERYSWTKSARCRPPCR